MNLSRKLAREAFAHGEFNDCSVRSIAILSGRPYAEVLAAFTKVGRRAQDGAYPFETVAAVGLLGYRLQALGERHERRKDPPPTWVQKIISRYPGRHKTRTSLTTHHPVIFHDAWIVLGPLLLEAHGHHCAYKFGVVHDPAAMKSCRIVAAYRLIKTQSKTLDQRALDVGFRLVQSRRDLSVV